MKNVLNYVLLSLSDQVDHVHGCCKNNNIYKFKRRHWNLRFKAREAIADGESTTWGLKSQREQFSTNSGMLIFVVSIYEEPHTVAS